MGKIKPKQKSWKINQFVEKKNPLTQKSSCCFVPLLTEEEKQTNGNEIPKKCGPPPGKMYQQQPFTPF